MCRDDVFRSVQIIRVPTNLTAPRLFIYLLQQTKDPKVTNMPHSNESVLTQKEPVKYTNKKDNRYKTTKTTKVQKQLQKILVVNKKSNTGQYYYE